MPLPTSVTVVAAPAWREGRRGLSHCDRPRDEDARDTAKNRMRLLLDVDDRLDQIPRLVGHGPEGFLDLVEPVEGVVEKLARVHAIILDELEHLLDAVGTARAEAVLDRDVRLAEAEQHGGHAVRLRGRDASDARDVAVAPHELEGLVHALHVVNRDDGTVDLAAVGIENLLDRIAVLVADDVRRAVLPSELHAVGARADGKDASGSAQPCGRDGHEADGPDAEDDDRVTELDVRVVGGIEAGRHHVDGHEGILDRNPVGHVDEVGVGVVDLEVLGEYAVMGDHELEALDPAGVMGIVDAALLERRLLPIGRAARHDHAVAGLELGHELANLLHDAERLVPEDDVGQVKVIDDARVRGAGSYRRGPDDGVQRSARRSVLLNPAGLAL